jgi:hypothetical protein
MAHIDPASFALLNLSEVGWNSTSASTGVFAGNDAAFQIDQQAIETDSLSHAPVVVDDGLPVAPAVGTGVSRRITRGQWNLHQQEIERQYPLMTLPELRKFMAVKHNFSAR